MAGGLAVLMLLATLRLREMLRWRRCTAVALPHAGLWTGTGARLPIAFTLPSGLRVEAALRQYGRGAPPPAGRTIPILHDREDPQVVEHAAALPFLALLVAGLLAALAAVLGSWAADVLG